MRPKKTHSPYLPTVDGGGYKVLPRCPGDKNYLLYECLTFIYVYTSKYDYEARVERGKEGYGPSVSGRGRPSQFLSISEIGQVSDREKERERLGRPHLHSPIFCSRMYACALREQFPDKYTHARTHTRALIQAGWQKIC